MVKQKETVFVYYCMKTAKRLEMKKGEPKAPPGNR